MRQTKQRKKQEGITLVALVVTIVVLLILAGVSISMVLGDNGLIAKAKEAKEKYEQSALNDEAAMYELYGELSDYVGEYSKTTGVNVPNLKTGMTPIKFTEATSSTDGVAVTTTAGDTGWYDYTAKHWANAQTEDGSMWVWIPRFAYRLNGDGKTFDVVFLVGTTDTYYDQNGNIQTNVKRATASFTPDTTSTKYSTVYPYSNPENSDYTKASQANWEANTQIYGDAVRETSQKGTDSNLSTFYYGDYSFFPSLDGPLFKRGGRWSDGTYAGLFYFGRNNGGSGYTGGFRAVLV